MISTNLRHQKRKELTNFLVIYIDFAYFLLLSPFRLIRNETGNFTAKSWLPQKICCALFTILSIFWLIRELRLSVPTNAKQSKNPSKHFEMLLALLSFLVKGITVKKLWFNQAGLLDIVNWIAKNDECDGTPALPVVVKRKMWITQKSAIRLICSLYTVMVLTNLGIGRGLHGSSYGTDGDNEAWSLEWWWRKMEVAGQYNFFCISSHYSPVGGSGGGGIGQMLIAIPSLIGFITRHVLGSYADLFLLMAVLTVWTALKSFSLILEGSSEDEYLMSVFMSKVQVITLSRHPNYKCGGFLAGGRESKWVKVENYLKSIKILSKLINQVFGSHVTIFVLEAVVYYATSFDQVFIESHRGDGGRGHQEYGAMIRLVFYFTSACIILLFSADVCHQMNRLKEWLGREENRGEVPQDCLMIVLNEVDSNLVAVRGSDIFPVTYTLVANVSQLN